MKTQMKKILGTSLLLVFVSVARAQQGERTGNGGTISEVALVSERQNLEETANKVLRFFERTPELQVEFPEVNIEALVALRGRVNFDVTTDELRDRESVVRTCLNNNQNGVMSIVCNYEKWRSRTNARDQFVLAAHELFGLLGIEVSSIEYQDLMASYPISSRLARYVSLTSQYDLVYDNMNREIYNYFRLSGELFVISQFRSTYYRDGNDEGSGLTENGSRIVGIGYSVDKNRRQARRNAKTAAESNAVVRCEEINGDRCVVVELKSSCERSLYQRQVLQAPEFRRRMRRQAILDLISLKPKKCSAIAFASIERR